jgi:hypothetical protein
MGFTHWPKNIFISAVTVNLCKLLSLLSADHHPSIDWQTYAEIIIFKLKNSMHLSTCGFKLFKNNLAVTHGSWVIWVMGQSEWPIVSSVVYNTSVPRTRHRGCERARGIQTKQTKSRWVTTSPLYTSTLCWSRRDSLSDLQQNLQNTRLE